MPARACRGCLATDCRLYNIYKINLYEAFGDVVGSPIFESDDLPQHVCSMCLVQLTKYVSFRERCRLAQDLLEELKMQGIKLTTPFIQKIDRGKCNLLPNLKVVAPPCYDMIIHEMIPDKPPEPEPEAEATDHNVVEDHDVVEPLPPVEPPADQPKSASSYIFDSPVQIEQFKEKYQVDVVFLTKEQQIEEVKEKIVQSSTRPGAGPYCSDCGKSCRDDEFLEKHIKECHDEAAGPEQCEVCRCRFKAKEINKHLLYHKLKITCNLCGFVSKTIHSVRNHAQSKHGIGPLKSLPCKHCDELFDNRVALNTHVSEAHPNTLLWCRCCAELFMNTHGRVAHMKRVHKDFLKSVHKCQGVCKRTFANSEALERHASLTCENFNCVMCGDHFETLLVLKEHVVQQHSRSKYVKMAQCSECGVKFFGTEPLEKHLGEMFCGTGVPCQVCGVSLPTTQAMEDHKAEFHPKLYRACEFCDKGFDSDNYRHHIQRVHNIKPPSRYVKGIHSRSSTRVWTVHGGIIRGQPTEARPEPDEKPEKTHMCDFCGLTFAKYQLLKYHRYVHTGDRPYKCDVCQKGFVKSSSLKTHMRLHTGEKPYVCQHCPKRFRSNAAIARHLVTHNGIRRHICHICNKAFLTSNNVKLHIKGVHLNLPVRGPRKRQFNALNRKNTQDMNNYAQGTDVTRTQGDMDDVQEQGLNGQEQGLMDNDIKKDYMDSETSTAVEMITGNIERPNKKRRIEDLNSAQNFTDTNTQDFRDSENLRDIPYAAGEIRVKTAKKRGRSKQQNHMDGSARTQNYMVTQDYMDNDGTQDHMVYDTFSRDITVTAVPRIIRTINIRQRKKPMAHTFDSDTHQVLMDTQVNMDTSSAQNDMRNRQDSINSGTNIQKQVFNIKQRKKPVERSMPALNFDSDTHQVLMDTQVNMDSFSAQNDIGNRQDYIDSGTNIQKQVFLGSGTSINATNKQIILARHGLGKEKKYFIVGRAGTKKYTNP